MNAEILESGDANPSAEERPAVAASRGDLRSGVEAELTRWLARESRTLLARVELAACEIGRSELTPALRGRVDVVRDAVLEIETMLVKIDTLSKVVPTEAGVESALDVVWLRLTQRIGPALGVRGFVVGRTLDGMIPPVGLSDRALEAVLLSYVRGWLSNLGMARGSSMGEITPRVSVRDRWVRLGLSAADEVPVEAGGAASPFRSNAALRALEVSLAEHGCGLESSGGSAHPDLLLPLAGRS